MQQSDNGRLLSNKNKKSRETHRVLIHPRVLSKRPWIGERQLITTWRRAFRLAPRQGNHEPPQTMAVGWDDEGRLMEMLSFADGDTQVIFHAAPARKKFLLEIGFNEQTIRDFIGGR